MPSVKCTLESCGYRNKKGYCSRKTITLQVCRDEFNELYCLGWATPETRLFTNVLEATSPALGNEKATQ